MKILVVSQCFWPEEFRINDICLGLKELGHEVEVLTGLPNYPQGEFYNGYGFLQRGSDNYNDIKLHRAFVVPRGKGSSIRLALNYLSFMIFASFKLSKLLFKTFDKLFVFQVSPITCAIPALIYKWIKKVPAAIYIQDLWPETFFSVIKVENKIVKKLLKAICMRIYKGFDQVFIASEGYKDILVEAGISLEKIIFLPQWAENIFNIKVDELVTDITKEEDEIIITFAGNIGKAQSVETIIEAAKICRDNKKIKWVIIGDGSSFEEIKKKVDDYELKESVLLLGRKPLVDMPKYYNASDALLVTLKNTEILRITLPAKIQSYMASGKMIIGSISGEGNRVIKESSCGYVCEAEDHHMLAKLAVHLQELTDAERLRYGRNGLNYSNHNYNRKKLLNFLSEQLAVEEAKYV